MTNIKNMLKAFLIRLRLRKEYFFLQALAATKYPEWVHTLFLIVLGLRLF